MSARPDNDDDDCGMSKIQLRYMETMSSHIQAAVAMCIVTGLDREGFIGFCGSAYDFVGDWNEKVKDRKLR
jgi:hypothetical protein